MTTQDLLIVAHRKISAAIPDYLPAYAQALLENGLYRMLDSFSKEQVDDTVAALMAPFIVVDNSITFSGGASGTLPDMFRVKSLFIERVIDEINIVDWGQAQQPNADLIIELEKMTPGRKNIKCTIQYGTTQTVYIDYVGRLKYIVKDNAGQPVPYIQSNTMGPTLRVLQSCYVEAGNPATMGDSLSQASLLFPRYYVETFGGVRRIRLLPATMVVTSARLTYVKSLSPMPSYSGNTNLDPLIPQDVQYLWADFIAQEYIENINAYRAIAIKKGAIIEQK